jgi:hypothetical protein
MDLPEVHQALLDAAALAEHAAELAANTSILDVLVKAATDTHADPDPVSLERATHMLREGQIVGIQVRYLRDDEEWRDTLMRTNQGTRLVRICTDRT